MKYKLLIISTVIITAGFFGIRWFKNFIAIDSCLDHGGSWNYELGKCDESNNSELYGQRINELRLEGKYEELGILLDEMIENKVNHQTAFMLKGLISELLNHDIETAYSFYKSSHEVTDQMDLPKEEKELDYVLYLKLTNKDSLSQIELDKVRTKFPDNEFVNSFGTILEEVDIIDYKRQLLNLN